MRLLTILTITLLTACATSGQQITEREAVQFVKGQSTESDVRAKLGDPTRMTTAGDGTRVLTYAGGQYTTNPAVFIPIVGLLFAGGEIKSSAGVFSFDRYGVLDSVGFSTYGNKY